MVMTRTSREDTEVSTAKGPTDQHRLRVYPGPYTVVDTETPESYVWAVGFALAIALHVAATHTFDTTKAWIIGEHASVNPVVVSGVLVVILIVGLWHARGESISKREAHATLVRVWPWMIATLAAVTSIAAGGAIDQLVSGAISPPDVVGATVMTIGAMVSTCGLFRYRHAFGARAQYPRVAEQIDQRRCLIVLISNIDPERAGPCSDGVPQWLSKEIPALLPKSAQTPPPLRELIKSVSALKKKNPNWPWEMPLRAILAQTRIELLTLVCSPESIVQVRDFVTLVARMPDTRHIQQVVWAKHHKRKDEYCALDIATADVTDWTGFGFENLDDLSSGFSALLQYLRRHGVDDEDVMLDFTGGQKPPSVVCACMTFNRKLHAQYVQTSYPWEPISYDLSVESERPIAG